MFLTIGGCEKQASNAIYDSSYRDEIKFIRNDFGHYLARNNIPGGNIAIALDNKIIYSEGIGLASKDMEVPMTRKNILRIGNVSQLFTSIIYLKLVEEGLLEPDSTVQHYIKEYPATDHRLDIKHLPYHTSGIRQEDPSENEISGENMSIRKGLETFMNDPLSNAPGVFEEPSIFNTNLLGAIMERTTKKRYPVLLREYVTDTLNLTNTVVDNPLTTIKGRTDFYDQNMMGQVVNAPFRDMRYKAPANGILSNAEDLVKLGMAILESDYFSEDFTRKLFESCDLYGGFKSKMANGWLLTSDKEGRDVNLSSGSVTGGGAVILIYPDEKLVMAYTQNLTLGIETLPMFKIANLILEGAE
ncbi:MAG: serine hydrolase domain-containing protein [Draconibacterium sp.]|nr:serine hydrolase domain-containing protein [Draconibacterium sp.]